MSLARTGSVDAGELYSFLTNDTNAINNVIAVTGQVAAISVALAGATFVYGAIRGGANPNVTDFRLNEVLNDLTRDQTAAQNIVLTTGYALMVSSLYFFLAQLGEPAKRRRIFDFGSNINRQGGIPNPLDFIFGFLDGQLSYATTLRFIVFYGLGSFGVILFWALMSILPNTPPGKKRKKREMKQSLKEELPQILREEEFHQLLAKIHENQFQYS